MRLAPSMTRDTQFFWDGLKDRKLLIQRCSRCGVLRHPPRPMCPQCNAFSWDAIESSGRGVVYSFVMPRHPQFPIIEFPYVVVLVELAEGTRLVSNLCGVADADVKIGMPVEVFFEEFDDGLVLPQFRLRKD